MQAPRDLPAPPSLRELRAAGPVALFLDFDGTLIELAQTPDAIYVPATLQTDLDDLALTLDGRLALVSGRAVENLARHLGNMTLACAGSHGIDRRRADGTPLGDVPERFPDAVVARLDSFASKAGFALETKPHGAALHYRGRQELEARGIAFAHALADEQGLAVKRGKCVIELTRPGADKGGAVRAFMDAHPFAGALPIFLGDDVTDEDGFAAALDLGGSAIVVGERRPTSAPFALPGPASVLEWLGLRTDG